MSDPSFPNFDTMTTAEFEQYLPDLFADSNGKLSTDPRLQAFLSCHPDCAALVRDLETIAEHAKSLFEPDYEPSDDVWTNIQSKLQQENPGDNDLPLAAKS
ncbi:hypothetical protein GCM10011507_30140 [Edaphobacter acidisoli]|uniref:Uncharacterized protein n=1 Tax=Edaphobacter acidisoli TaxID=2040573 RepID=A0A916RYM5_9BACT|nr:hypothetical protein [Edaphobacter acidisoli]GGA76798.1 hypothetical protein GCM10011507_30140 [Edaphobacter acidisoli]